MTNEADPFFQPISAMELARFAGVPTFMRLPLSLIHISEPTRPY